MSAAYVRTVAAQDAYIEAMHAPGNKGRGTPGGRSTPTCKTDCPRCGLPIYGEHATETECITALKGHTHFLRQAHKAQTATIKRQRRTLATVRSKTVEGFQSRIVALEQGQAKLQLQVDQLLQNMRLVYAEMTQRRAK